MFRSNLFQAYIARIRTTTCILNDMTLSSSELIKLYLVCVFTFFQEIFFRNILSEYMSGFPYIHGPHNQSRLVCYLYRGQLQFYNNVLIMVISTMVKTTACCCLSQTNSIGYLASFYIKKKLNKTSRPTPSAAHKFKDKIL